MKHFADITWIIHTELSTSKLLKSDDFRQRHSKVKWWAFFRHTVVAKAFATSEGGQVK